MRRLCLLLATAAGALLALAAPAGAQFGLSEVDVTFTGPPSEEAVQAQPTALGPILTGAGEHPFAMTTSFRVNGEETEAGGFLPEEAIRDLLFTQVEGFAGAPTAVPACPAVDFLTADGQYPSCPDSSVVGYVAYELADATITPITSYAPLYNVEASPGTAAKLGFWTLAVPVTVDARLEEEPPFRVTAGTTNTAQLAEVVGSELTLWGVPADPRHDHIRGRCLGAPGESLGECSAGVEKDQATAFLTMPRACAGPLDTSWFARSWLGSTAAGAALTHDEAGNPRGMDGCGALRFAPRISASPTTRAAQSPTGLDFSLTVPDEGIENPEGRAGTDVERAVVTLPRGMTINPAQAEGLEVCSEARLGRERSDSAPGEGCPEASKIGTIEVETPLLKGELLRGSLYVAEPYRNLADDALIAVYAVIRHRERGVLVTQPIEVEPDPATGQLIGVAEEIPQLPFSEFRLHFREGARSPLVSPPGCGSFAVEAELHPHSGAAPVASTSTFEIVSGPDNSPCPSGAAPFRPGFAAGTLSNAAGSYSPFHMRLTRRDGEQDMVKFSAVLPPGVLGRIAGVPWCPEAGIARARSRTGPEGGRDELADPSCPAASAIGRTAAGAGVGPQLTYVPGSLYLAGPYKGASLSVVSITPAVAGPFDVGTVVVRVGLRLNPRTGVAEADGAASEAIPHLLRGIPLNVRDLRVYVDRPGFTLNATSCEPSSAFATLWGGGTALAPSPEVPAGLAAPYQAASCASLGFKPRLGVKLRGGTRRGAFPALRAHYRPRPGDANLKRLALLFPSSAFVEQGHFRTICTRVLFAAGPGHGAACPKGSIYGRARVWTPLLDEPLRGPVILRSSDHNLPDAVLALSGLVDIEVTVRIDSVKGRLRATVENAPDAPVSRAIVDMQGGPKGLIVNSRNLCRKQKRNRARANIRAQSGRLSRIRPAVRAVRCKRGRRGGQRRSPQRG